MPSWNRLRRVIPRGEVLMPGHEGYPASLKRWSAAAERNSTVVVKPTCADEVSSAVKFAVASNFPLTVCGGGHSSSGTSSSEGMVIHLEKMRNVSVDKANMTVSFEGGCLWADVDGALETHGLATVGGAVNHTGVGGLILGGGHGWLTAKHGLSIDNLISVQIVTANGSILEASETQNPDLFWAIRGAGAQFGVVTRFVFRVYKQEKVWSGILTFTPDKLPELVTFANEFHNRDNREGHCLAIGVGHIPNETTRILSAIPLYHGPEKEAKRYFAKLLGVGPIADSTMMTSIAQVNTLQNPISEHGIRRLQGSSNVTMPIDEASLQQAADMLWSFQDMHPSMRVCVMGIEIFSTHKLLEVPQHATAYANRGEFYDAVTVLGWTDLRLDDTVRQFNRRVCEHVRHTNGYNHPGSGGRDDGGEVPVGRYLNMEPERLKPEEAYGGNLERLRNVKKRFDPDNVFYKWHGVGVEGEAT